MPMPTSLPTSSATALPSPSSLAEVPCDAGVSSNFMFVFFIGAAITVAVMAVVVLFREKDLYKEQ